MIKIGDNGYVEPGVAQTILTEAMTASPAFKAYVEKRVANSIPFRSVVEKKKEDLREMVREAIREELAPLREQVERFTALMTRVSEVAEKLKK